MVIRKAYRYRLYPTHPQAAVLDRILLRCRGRDRYDSFTLSQAGWKITNGRLVLTGIGALKVKWSRPIQGTIKTVTIRRDADH